MDRLERASLLVALIEKLRESARCTLETHLQKAAYVLERVLEVPIDFEFTLYKHEPFSFDLRQEIGSLRADGFLEWELNSEACGPGLKPGPLSSILKSQFPATPQTFSKEIEFVGSHLAPKSVAELERLAAALYVTLEGSRSAEPRTTRIRDLKQRVSAPEAEAAIAEADRILAEAKTQFHRAARA